MKDAAIGIGCGLVMSFVVSGAMVLNYKFCVWLWAAL